MSKIRKAFVVSIMMMTVLSMSVVVAPQAEAASAGDLIKMNGLSSVYFLGADGKRYVFPNESTYFSWYSDFSGVVTISQSELESYPLGKNVTVRPGTKMVKITTDPKVYAVEPNGNLVWVPSEAVAATLYGADWAKRIVDVPDSFFMSYTVTGAQVSAAAYPAGSLVKYAEDATVYWIGTDGKAYPFASEAAFLANRFKWSDVLNATIAKPATGDAITGAIAAVIDTSSGAGGQAGAGTGLTISLSGDTPGSVNIPSPSNLVPFLAVNLTASNDGAVTVQQMSFTRRGTGLPASLSGYLFVGNERLTNVRTVNTSDNRITFSALNLTVPAGQTKTVMLKINSSAGKTDNHYFELASASMVSTNGAVVSGSFPIEGNLMSFANVPAAEVKISTTFGPVDRKVGETDVVLAEFDIENTTSAEDVNIYSIRLKNEGTAGDNAVGNISLLIDGGVVASDVDMVNDYITFTLDTPFALEKNDSVTAEVRGDILTDVNKTIQFVLKDVGDIDVRGTAYGDFYSAIVDNDLALTDTQPVNIKGSEINVSFDGPQSADVKNDTKNVVLANFMIKSESEDVDIDTLTVTLLQEGDANNLPLENFELVDKTNNVTYGSDGVVASSASQTLTFSNILLSAGTQYNFEIQGDIQDDTNAGATFKVTINFLSGFTAEYVQSDTAVVPANDISSTGLTGKVMTVAAPTMTVARVITNAASTVKDADGVLLYKGKMTASNVDDIRVSRIVVNSEIGHNNAQFFSTDWERLGLYRVNTDGTESLLKSETSLGSASVTFSSFTLTVPKGLNNGVFFVIRGDVKSNPSGTTTELMLANTGWTVRDADNNTVTGVTIGADKGHVTSVVTQGSIVVEINTEESGINIDKNVLAGTNALIGRVKLTATNEAAELDDLVIENEGNATNATLGRICLYEDKALTELLQCADVAANDKALFQDLNFEVPTAGVTYLYISGMIKGIDYSSSPSADKTGDENTTVRLFVPADSGAYAFEAVGKSTGEILTSPFALASSTAWTRQATVMGAVVSGLSTSFANGTLTAGIAKDIFSFKVTAPDSSNVDYDSTELGARLYTVAFSVATSGAYTLASYKIERVGGANGEKTATAVVSGDTIAVDFDATYGSDADGIIRPGDTAEYVLRATIGGTIADNNSLQVTIEAVDTNVRFTHNTGTNGVQGADATSVAPKLSGVTSVRGGTLTK